MVGGDGARSYAKNSCHQRVVVDATKEMVKDAIADNLELKTMEIDASRTFKMVDLGSSTGPNTFIAVQNIIEAVEQKYLAQHQNPSALEFQVFFNDHYDNDFNTLFKSLPPSRNYFATGVPGSFHSRLFPNSTLHFVYGDCNIYCKIYDLLGSCLIDLVKMELISEEKVDSFNFPLYYPTPKEFETIIEINGLFTIERTNILAYAAMEKTFSAVDSTSKIRAVFEGLIKEHFGNEVVNQIFNHFTTKLLTGNILTIDDLENHNKIDLFISLKRIDHQLI
ncbi:loganic acid O-methyltransferase-like [Pistacia vera]|uniref:loganic acid O-methyltransferase-like n=1 Tax=Pistacia vera TaxID=55513 RepID=UPI001263A329|nr:loganic acid O-methyltransferase-like [Pistacia vera]